MATPATWIKLRVRSAHSARTNWTMLRELVLFVDVNSLCSDKDIEVHRVPLLVVILKDLHGGSEPPQEVCLNGDIDGGLEHDHDQERATGPRAGYPFLALVHER